MSYFARIYLLYCIFLYISSYFTNKAGQTKAPAKTGVIVPYDAVFPANYRIVIRRTIIAEITPITMPAMVPLSSRNGR